MDNTQLNAEVRTETGKGPARRLRSIGRLPAIFYGPGINPIMVSLDCSQIEKVLKGRSAENIIFDLKIDPDKNNEPKKAMIKEMQRDPVTREFLHLDLYEIAMGKEIETDIPIQFIKTPIGVSRGGILEHLQRSVKVSYLPKDLVAKIDIDVSSLDIGQSLHIKDISFPPGLKSLEDGSNIIAKVVSPSKVTEEVVAEEEKPESEETKVEEES
ncbi:MAG TPA: 50S ribosomal protein L25 [Desulfatiglandales bacterium]|nr:50S ribosomal protein L25 [Desulfatiglandales bacterium]